MIAIIVPTRGLTFTQTDILIDSVVYKYDCKVFRSYDMEIPKAPNYLVEKALETDAEYFLFIEEDNVPTLKQIDDMINRDTDICFVDYGVNGWSCSAQNKRGEILWCGLGVTLVKRKVFETLEKPWFRTDKSYRLNDNKWVDIPMKYGGHDIYFFVKAREAGFKIVKIEGEAGHLKLDSIGSPEVNHGLHLISEKPRIGKYQIIS